jgi:hypothetical protein
MWNGNDCVPLVSRGLEDALPIKTMFRGLTDLTFSDLNEFVKKHTQTEKKGECKGTSNEYYETRGGRCRPTGNCKPDFRKIQGKCISNNVGKICDYPGRFIGQIDYNGDCKSNNICRRDFILYNGECISQNLGNKCKISSTSFINDKTMITEDGLVDEDGTCNKFLTKNPPSSSFFGNYTISNSDKKCYIGFSGYSDCLYKPSNNNSMANMGSIGSFNFGSGGFGGCTIQ